MTVRTLFALALAALGAPAASRAQQLEPPPPELDGVGITERPNSALPLDLAFRDERGETVALGEYFTEGRPVLLNLVYFDCPMLCNVFLDGLVTTLGKLDWTPGKEFRVVTVSIDPTDGPEGARAERGHYVERLGRPEAAEGWHFLTGSEENVRRLADAVGFAYRYDEERRQYMHSAGLFVATPEGRLSRTLYGVAFDATTLRLSLVEASEGRVGSAMDQLLLFCFAYDHTAGRYGPAALKLVRAFGAVTACALGLFLATHWRREAVRRALAAGART